VLALRVLFAVDAVLVCVSVNGFAGRLVSVASSLSRFPGFFWFSAVCWIRTVHDHYGLFVAPRVLLAAGAILVVESLPESVRCLSLSSLIKIIFLL